MVAIKLLLSVDERGQARFRREVHLLASLRHQRFLVTFRSQNGHRYLMGTTHSPVRATVTDRIIGEADDNARNELKLAFTLRDRFPVPFHRV